MFLIRWLLYINSIIPALILFPIKKIYLRKEKKPKYKGPKIIAMNHTAFLDYVEALLAFPGRRKYVLSERSSMHLIRSLLSCSRQWALSALTK